MYEGKLAASGGHGFSLAPAPKGGTSRVAISTAYLEKFMGQLLNTIPAGLGAVRYTAYAIR